MAPADANKLNALNTSQEAKDPPHVATIRTPCLL